MDGLDGYRALVALAERERDLIDAGRWDDLAGIERDRRAIGATLPDLPPAEARPFLEQAGELVVGNVERIAAAIEQTRAELTQLGQGRRALASYAAGPAAARFVDERR